MNFAQFSFHCVIYLYIQRTEQVLTELDISAIEEYIIIRLLLFTKNALLILITHEIV